MANFNLLPFMIAAAAANPSSQVKTPPIVGQILQYAAGIGGGIIAIFLIIGLVKDGIAYASGNGNGSIWKIIGKVLFLILIIGLIFLALNWQNLGTIAEGFGSNVIDQGTSIIDGALAQP